MTYRFRVYFRALEPDDYKTSVQWRRDEAIWAGVVGRRFYVSEEYERQWVHRKITGETGSETFAVCLRESDQYIGNAYLREIDLFNRSCVSGRLIGCPEQRGRGLGFEVTLLLLRHAFFELGLERVSSRQLTTNAASIRSLEKAGYRHEGVARKAIMKNGELVDLNLMGCLREDFLPVWDDFTRDSV